MVAAMAELSNLQVPEKVVFEFSCQNNVTILYLLPRVHQRCTDNQLQFLHHCQSSSPRQHRPNPHRIQHHRVRNQPTIAQKEQLSHFQLKIFEKLSHGFYWIFY